MSVQKNWPILRFRINYAGSRGVEEVQAHSLRELVASFSSCLAEYEDGQNEKQEGEVE